MLLDTITGDKKIMKQMAESLNQDILNPKNSVYYQGLQQALKQKGNQQQAIQKLQQQFAQSMQDKMRAMMPVPQQDPKATLELAQANLDVEKATNEVRQKYQFIISPDGTKVWAVNKNDPKDAFQVKDANSGEAVTGQGKGTGTDGLKTNGGVPIYIKRGSDLRTPDSPNWTADDERIWDSAIDAGKRKQDLRIDPIIADQLGEPPDPSKYQGGKASPAYGRALKEYGLQAEAIKDRMAASAGTARAKAYNEYRPLQVYNPETKSIEWTTAKDAIARGLTPGPAAQSLLPKSSQIADIDFASKQMRSAVQNIDKPFTPDQVAKLDLALSTPDQGLSHTILSTLATQELTDKQQDFVIWADNLNERAMSLRSIAGQGQGAQDTRNAIRALLPGVQSGSKEMQTKQLDAFDNMVGILKKGIAGVKGAGQETPAAGGGPKVGTVENGYRFKGGNPADPNAWQKVQ
jgi:hypothetical protein